MTGVRLRGLQESDQKYIVVDIYGLPMPTGIVAHA